MTKGRKGLWLSIGGYSHADKVERAIAERGSFSKVVPSSDVQPRYAESVVVSLRGNSADYLGVSQKSRSNVGTDENAIIISNCVLLRDTSIDRIRAQLPRKFRDRFAPPDNTGIYRPTPTLWREVLAAIRRLNPDVERAINSVIHLSEVRPEARRRFDLGLGAFERDAVGTAIQTWGGPELRKQVLREAESRSPSGAELAPFLSRIRTGAIREDVAIYHDQMYFPDLELERSHVVGSLVLSNARKGERLTILNCNRMPLESTLGVDLIYYNHRYDSYVCVQYKRMTAGKDRRAIYRPDGDANHAKEMALMDRADGLLDSISLTNLEPNAFRLSRSAFYLKLCESRVSNPLDAGLTPGMYLPLDLWRRLLKSPCVKGPKGGVGITWDNCTRRFSNEEFTRLLSQGWIGSVPEQTATLNQIIATVLESGRMLILAMNQSSNPSISYRRDSFGRFASDADSSASY